MCGKHQVIVMHPDEIIFFRGTGDGSGEFAIDALVGLPIIGIEVAA